METNKDQSQWSRQEKAPDLKYYQGQLRVVSELVEKSSQLRFSFFQHILLVSSSILGILIALHSSNSPYIYIRLVFLLALVLFALGILSTGVVVHDLSLLVADIQLKYSKEVQRASRADREANPVFAAKKKRTLLLEKWCLILLSSGLFVLVLYGALVALM